MNNRRSILESFNKAVDQSSFVLKESPELVFSQIYNRLQRQMENNILLKNKLEYEKNKIKKPWFRLLNKPIESSGLQRTLAGHKNAVNGCVFSPDGKFVFSVSADTTVRKWDLLSGQEVGFIDRDIHDHQCCSLSSDGKRFAWASSNGVITVVDTSTLKRVGFIHFTAGWICVLSPDGRKVMGDDFGGKVSIYNVENSKDCVELHDHKNVVSCDFSPDGKYVITAAGTLKIWDANTGKEESTFKKDSCDICIGKFNQDGSKLLIGGSKGELILLDRWTEEIILTFNGHIGEINNADFNPDGDKIITASSDTTLKLWDIRTGEELSTFKGHSDKVKSCHFSPDGKQVVSAGDDSTIRIWDVEEYGTAEGEDIRIEGKILDHSSNGEYISSQSEAYELVLWDVKDKIKEKYRISGGNTHIMDGSFSMDCRRFVTVDMNLVIKLFDYEQGSLIVVLKDPSSPYRSVNKNFDNFQKKLNNGNPLSHRFTVDISPDSKWVVFSSWDKDLYLSDMENGKIVKIFKGLEDEILRCTFSGDGTIVAATDRARRMKMWDIQSGKEIYNHNKMFWSVIFTSLPGSKKFIFESVSDQKLIILDVDSREEILIGSPHGNYRIMDINLEGNRIVFYCHNYDDTSINSDTLEIWNTETGDKVNILKRVGEVDDVSFSPDGRFIVSRSKNKTLRLWDTESGQNLTTLKGFTGRILTYKFLSNDRQIVIADDAGRIFHLSIENIVDK